MSEFEASQSRSHIGAVIGSSQ